MSFVGERRLSNEIKNKEYSLNFQKINSFAHDLKFFGSIFFLA